MNEYKFAVQQKIKHVPSGEIGVVLTRAMSGHGVATYFVRTEAKQLIWAEADCVAVGA